MNYNATNDKGSKKNSYRKPDIPLNKQIYACNRLRKVFEQPPIYSGRPGLGGVGGGKSKVLRWLRSGDSEKSMERRCGDLV